VKFQEEEKELTEKQEEEILSKLKDPIIGRSVFAAL